MAAVDEDDMLRKAELLAAQMQGLAADTLNIDNNEESSSPIQESNNNNVDDVLLETERLIAQMGGGFVSDNNTAGVGGPMTFRSSTTETPAPIESSNNSTDSVDDMLKRAELLANQMQSSTTSFPDSKGVEPDTPSLLREVDAALRSNDMVPVTSGKTPGKKTFDTPGLINHADMLLEQKKSSSTAGLPAGKGNDLNSDMLMETEENMQPQSMKRADSVENMLKQAELLANQMQSATNQYSNPGTPPLAFDTPGLINHADMLLEQKKSPSTAGFTTGNGNDLNSDMIMEAEENMQSQSMKRADSVENMLKQAELLANEMQSATNKYSNPGTPPLVDEEDLHDSNMQSREPESPIEDMLKKAELLANQMQSTKKLDFYEEPDTPSLLREADTVLRSNANPTLTGDSLVKNQTAASELKQQTNMVLGQEEPSKSVAVTDGFDDVMRQTEMLLGKIQNPMSCNTADQTSATADMSTSLDKSTVPQSPFVTPAGNSDTGKLSAQTEQLQQTEEMVRIMAQTLASLQEPNAPSDVNQTLEASAAIMQQAMSSLKDQCTTPEAPTPPRSISMARSPSFEEEVSSVGSGSARSVGYPGFDSPGSAFNKTPTATNHRAIAPMPPMHSRGDRPPLPRPPLTTVEAAEESARQMATASQESSKKQTAVPPQPPPLPLSIPKMTPSAAEEKLYESLVKKMDNQRPKKYVKVKPVARTDDDYVPIKDYSKFGSDRKKSEYGDDYVPMVDYTRRSSKATNSTTSRSVGTRVTTLQRYQRKKARRRKMVKIALVVAGIMVLIYSFSYSTKQEDSTSGGEGLDDQPPVIKEVERAAVPTVGDTIPEDDDLDDIDSDKMSGSVVDDMVTLEEEDHSDAIEEHASGLDEIKSDGMSASVADEVVTHEEEGNPPEANEASITLEYETITQEEVEDTAEDDHASAYNQDSTDKDMENPVTSSAQNVVHENIDYAIIDPSKIVDDSVSGLVTQPSLSLENPKKKRGIWQPLRALGLARTSSSAEKNKSRRKGLLKSFRAVALFGIFMIPLRLLLGILAI